MATRRDTLTVLFLVVGGYAALRYGLPHVWSGQTGDFEFEPLAEPAGFRRLTAGPTTAAFDPFIGLEADEPKPIQPAVIAPADVRMHLFGSETAPADVVPVASFSDYHCPYCRVLTEDLVAISDAGEKIAVTWHELPLLGPMSLAAARAALAADRQGAYAAFHRRLMRSSFQPDPAFIEALAASIGLAPDRMLSDMHDADIDRQLSLSAGLAGTLGIFATPALVVGRTVVIGAIGPDRLRALIELERAEGIVGI
ncbi:MAG: DsbA family protein [Pseudomonadota bacterium]